MLAILSSIAAALTLAGLVTLGLFQMAILVLVGLHLWLRARGMAHERALLARPLPADETLPHVVVQLPCFNEGALVARAVRHAAAFDWPRDKLHIQVLDDSTEPMHEETKAAIDSARSAGLDLVVLTRPDRSEFKAGALREGMAAAPYEYFAIFDVDYVPQPDFLRLAMRGFADMPVPAFVQGRFDYINADENALTRVQRLLLDGHLGVEQATRSWAGHPLPFNGTCGIWRRSAIEAAGGWHGDTLAEDLDLSYRALLAGHRGIFLVGVAASGELPVDTETWSRQQQRWAAGFGQVAIKILGEVLRSPRLTAWQRFGAFLHLSMWWEQVVVMATVLVGALAIVLNPPTALWIVPAAILLGATWIASRILMFWIGSQFLRPGVITAAEFRRDVVTLFLGGIRVTLGNIFTNGKALLGRRMTFVRTRKRG